MSIVHLYVSIRDEDFMTPYFLRHYAPICDKIFVWEDQSVDGTYEMLKACPKVQFLPLAIHGIDDAYLQKIRSETYRTFSRGIADWVIIIDIDEFHWHTIDLMGMLDTAKEKGYKAMLSEGYQMISDKPPSGDGQIYSEIREGVQDHMYDRLIFNPELDVTVGIGHHCYDVKGAYVCHNAGHKLLHYRYMGEEYMTKRHARVYSNLTENNLKHGWGIHSSPNWTGNYSVGWWREMMGRKRPCLD
jgi:hypothetical protein